jgi:exopolyphosphatase/guanosine-5'-triphosphate,3'-diphosphate pyrophosphatase
MVRILRDETEPKSMNGFKFTIKELEVVVDLLAQSPTVEMRRQLRGVDASRADIILAGALILDAIAHEFELQNFIFSDFALREGIILDTLQRTERLDHQHLHQVSLNSVMGLVERCDDDVAHSKNVARLALELYDSLEKEYDFSPQWRVLLEAASLLANVGLIVSHSKHHLHSYYVIRNSDLVGFTDHEIELVALIARYHRKGPPKPTHNEFAKLSETEQQLIIFLAGILRVAIGLDRSHDGRVTRLDVEIKKSSVDITVNTSMTQIDALEMNLYAARERQQLLETALGVPIMFVSGSDD